MKKLVVLISLLFLTGCTEKTTCTNNNENDTLKIDETLIVTHKGKKITKIENNVTYEIKDDTINENFKKTFNEIKETYNNEFINYNEEIKENTYKFDINYNPNKLTEEILNKINSSKRYDIYKQKILERGMKCE